MHEVKRNRGIYSAPWFFTPAMAQHEDPVVPGLPSLTFW